MLYRDYITEIKCRKKQVKALLNILTSQKGPWFKELVAALSSCENNPEYQQLVETLEPSNLLYDFRGAVWTTNKSDTNNRATNNSIRLKCIFGLVFNLF